MEKRESISDSLAKLSEKKVVKVKQLPALPLFVAVEEAKEVFIEVINAVDKSIKEFQWLPEYDKIVNWLVFPKRTGLFLVGDSGRLKSTITNLVLPVLYYNAYGFIVRSVDSDKIDESWGKIKNGPIIIVDDMGVEPTVSDYGIKREPMNSLIDFCEKNSKILIMTSNLTSSQINSRYGIRTQDRMDLLCTAVKFKGESLR